MSKKKRAVRICCPWCEGEFGLAAVQGPFLDRHCPLCDGRLNPEAFDHKAKEMLSEITSYRTADETHKRSATRWARFARTLRRWHLGVLGRRVRRVELYHRWSANYEAEEAMRTESKLTRLAEGRYYADEWYLCSGMTLRGPSPACASSHLRALYDIGGAFSLVPECEPVRGPKIVMGALGEMLVFGEALAAIRAGTLPTGSRLVPNAFLLSEASPENCPGW